MSTYAEWKPEIVALLNKKNNSQLMPDDLELEIVERNEAIVNVKVLPNPGSKYYGETSITYVRRDLAHLLLNIPLRVIVQGDTTVGALLHAVAQKYGVSFDDAVDFAQEELDKVVSFADSGLKTVELPAADTSFVWVGELTITAANDGLDLQSIIKNFDLTELKYIQIDSEKTSVAFQTFPVDYSAVAGVKDLAVGDTLTEEMATALVEHTKESEDVVSEADLLTALTGGKVKAIEEGDTANTATITIQPQNTYGGDAFLTYLTAAPSQGFQATMDQYGPAKLVVTGLLSMPPTTPWPISSFVSEYDTCDQILNFENDNYTATVVPILLKQINLLGNYGISDDDIAAIAASVKPEVTTLNTLGHNVRTLKFSDNKGHAEIGELVITFERQLTMLKNYGLAAYQREVTQLSDLMTPAMSMSVVKQVIGQDITAVTAESRLAATRSAVQMMQGASTGTVDFSGWTQVMSYVSPFDTPQVADKYQMKQTIYLNSDKTKLGLLIEGSEYATGFDARFADDIRLVVPLGGNNIQLPLAWSGSSDNGANVFSATTSVPSTATACDLAAVGFVLLASLKGVVRSTYATNNQSRFVIQGLSVISALATNKLDSFATAIVETYGTPDQLFYKAFMSDLPQQRYSIRPELLTLKTRYLDKGISPVEGKSPEAYIWDKLMTEAYGFEAGFIQYASVSANYENNQVAFTYTLNDANLAKASWLNPMETMGYVLPSDVPAVMLTGIRELSPGYANPDVFKTDGTVAPADAVGDVFGNVINGTLTRSQLFGAMDAVEYAFGPTAFDGKPGLLDLSTFTKVNEQDITSLIPDNVYNWSTYIQSMTATVYGKGDELLLVFHATPKDEFVGIVTNTHENALQSEDGGYWYLRNSFGTSLADVDAVVDEFNSKVGSTANVKWTDLALVAGTRLDNRGLEVADTTVSRDTPVPGTNGNWRFKGTAA